MPSLLDSNAPNQLFGCIIQKRNPNSCKYEARSSMNHVMTKPNIVSIVVLILEISFMTHRILYIYLAANVWSSVIHQVHAKVVPIQAEEECRAMAAHICAIKFEKSAISIWQFPEILLIPKKKNSWNWQWFQIQAEEQCLAIGSTYNGAHKF